MSSSTDMILGYQVQLDYLLYTFVFALCLAFFWRIFASQIKSILYPNK